MGRIQHCSKSSDGALNRRHWTPEEDMLLKNYIEANGVGRWSALPQKAGLRRCGKSCRLRWMNHLRPNVKGGHISPEEEELIIRLHSLLGNRWSLIAGRVPGRTDNDVKNYWNVHLSKKLSRKNRRKFVKEQPSLSFVDNHKYMNASDAAPKINSVRHKHKVNSKSRCLDPTPKETFEPTYLRNLGVMPSDLDHSIQPQPLSLPLHNDKDHQMAVPVSGPTTTGESGELSRAPSVDEVNAYGILEDITACTVQSGEFEFNFDPSFDNFTQVEKCWDTLQSFSPYSWIESLPWFGYSTEEEIEGNNRFAEADNAI